MMQLIALIFLLLAVLGWIWSEQNKFKLLKLVHAALVLLTVDLIAFQNAESLDNPIVMGLGGLFIVHLILSYFLKLKDNWILPSIVLVSSGVFFVIPNPDIVVGDTTRSFNTVGAIIPWLIGSMAIPLLDLKEKKLAKFFKLDFKTQRGISRGGFFMLIGIGCLLAHFLMGYVGILIMTIAFSSVMMYAKRSGALWNILLALLGLSSLSFFVEYGGISDVELTVGRVLAGLLLHAGIALWVNTLQRARKNQTVASILSLTVVLVVPVLLLLAGTQNVQFGGVDAFVGLILGFVMTTLFGINIKKNIVILSVYMAIGLLVIPFTINQEEIAGTQLTIQSPKGNDSDTKKEVSIKNLEAVALDIEGNYSIAEASKVLFELGPAGGRTKGAIKGVSGTFDISGGTPKLNVEMSVESLTTFNSIRDESLMGETYFKADEYPKITFVSKSVKQAGLGFDVQGEMKMLGVSKSVNFTLKYIGKNDKNEPQFVGFGNLDRTDFGMTPDPTEGNVVDYTFQVILNGQK